MKYRKKPVVIEAERWFDNLQESQIVTRYVPPDSVPMTKPCEQCGSPLHDWHGWIDTLEGGHIVCPGDWVIAGVNGEHYPCKPDIFEKTYEAP